MIKQAFGEEDRKKKRTRISPESAQPSLTADTLVKLEEAIRSSLRDGYLPCPTAFAIAKKLDLPHKQVGNAADNLNIRIVSCQLGCFKIEKTAASGPADPLANQRIVEHIEALGAQDGLTCPAAFEIAGRLHVLPLDVANAANQIHSKIHNCQLGCF